MATTTQIKGQWNQIKGKVRERWGEFTDNEWQQLQGNTDALIGLIQRKTGTAREEIESFLRGVLQNSETAAASTLDGVRVAANRATEAAAEVGELANQQFAQISERFEDGYDSAKEIIRNQPGVSVGVAFAAGVLGGAILGILLRPGR